MKIYIVFLSYLFIILSCSAMETDYKVLIANGAQRKLPKAYAKYSKTLHTMQEDVKEDTSTQLDFSHLSKKEWGITRQLFECEESFDKAQQGKQKQIRLQKAMQRFEALVTTHPQEIVRIASYFNMKESLRKVIDFFMQHLDIMILNQFPEADQSIISRKLASSLTIDSAHDLYWEYLKVVKSRHINLGEQPQWLRSEEPSISATHGNMSAHIDRQNSTITLKLSDDDSYVLDVDQTTGPIACLCFNAPGTHLAYAARNRGFIWDILNKKMTANFDIALQPCNIFLTRDASKVVLASTSGMMADHPSTSAITVVNLLKRDSIRHDIKGVLCSAALHPSDSFVAFSNTSDIVEFFDIINENKFVFAKHYGGLMNEMKFNPQGTQLGYLTLDDCGLWDFSDITTDMHYQPTFEQICLMAHAKKCKQACSPLSIKQIPPENPLSKLFYSLPLHTQLACARAYDIELPYSREFITHKLIQKLHYTNAIIFPILTHLYNIFLKA